MRIVHKCRRQGSGSASPKGRARALAPSQSYRFVNNSHDLPTDGRRPQISPEISSCLCKVGRAKSPQSSGRSPGEAVGEIIPCLELAQAEERGSVPRIDAFFSRVSELPQCHSSEALMPTRTSACRARAFLRVLVSS